MSAFTEYDVRELSRLICWECGLNGQPEKCPEWAAMADSYLAAGRGSAYYDMADYWLTEQSSQGKIPEPGAYYCINKALFEARQGKKARDATAPPGYVPGKEIPQKIPQIPIPTEASVVPTWKIVVGVALGVVVLSYLLKK
jgi:hypothetical protein